jgi:ribosome recycling factor
MNYDFTQLKKKTKDTEEWLKKELSQVRTGRANIALLDGISADVYGTMTPLNQVGSLSIEDPRTLRLSVWDTSQIKSVEKAIAAANLGVSAIIDDKGIRIAFPELTGERRVGLVKIAKEKLEQAKTTLRKHRDDTWNDIQTKEKQGGMSEDEKFRFKSDMEKIIQETNKKLDEVTDKKEKEITS